jgi:hypothetical protein
MSHPAVARRRSPSYSTCLRGGADDVVARIAVDSCGNIYLSGTTASRNVPASSGAFDNLSRWLRHLIPKSHLKLAGWRQSASGIQAG